jgi:protein-disulfide isomerase
MNVGARRIAVLGALLGVFASAYLLIDYVWGSGICLTGTGCDTVRLSAFAYPLGIPMPLLGLGYYALAAAFIGLAPASVAERTRAGLLAGWSMIGIVVMATLTVIEVAVIHAVCSWCLLSAIASVLLGGGAMLGWLGARRVPAPAGHSARARRHADEVRLRADSSVRRFSLVTASVVAVAFGALVIAPTLAGQEAGTVDVSAPGNPVLGDGPVQVVIFSDFQCPGCAAAAPSLTELATDGRIALTYRFFPLTTIHANARAAALAAAAAAQQDRFWQFHDQLFARQTEWASLPPAEAQDAFTQIATDVGLDVARWQADLARPEVAAKVQADVQKATELALPGTPSIFIDGRRYTGRLDFASLSAAIPTPS